MTTFETSPTLARALAEHDYQEATPVQAAVIDRAANGRDLLVSAQTGSGKTVAYGLAIGHDILDDAGRVLPADAPLALVIAPTRELALQVQRELEWLYAYTGARIVACVGGMDPRLERRRLQEGATIVVGTPGRLRDHIERKSLKIESLSALVLDEADEMLDLGFREDLEFILEATPKERRTLLFSATMPKTIATMAQRYQRGAMRIEVAGKAGGHADIEYRAIRVFPNEVEHAVVNLLRLVEAPTSIVFCNTRDAVRHLQATLMERGFSVVLLSGELSQHERNQSMLALRDGRARVCVATDVAARGIDLPNLGLVIHADLPHDRETLQHRSGRTGRAGRKGVSALLVPPARKRRAEMLIREAGVFADWSGPPSAEEVRVLDRERMVADPIFAPRGEEDDGDMIDQLLAGRTAEDLATALVRLYAGRLPALEEPTDPGDRPQRRDAPLARSSERGDRPDRAPQQRERFEAGPRPERGPRRDMGGVWFRMDIGRERNADPKWIVPMLCRKGGINKGDIGTIRISRTETTFEISAEVANNFAVAVRRPGGETVNVQMIGEAGSPMPPRGEDREPDAGGEAKPKKFRAKK